MPKAELAAVSLKIVSHCYQVWEVGQTAAAGMFTSRTGDPSRVSVKKKSSGAGFRATHNGGALP